MNRGTGNSRFRGLPNVLDAKVETSATPIRFEISMALNIKNQKTCDLARELAELTDDTMTGAITVALESQLEQVKERRDKDQMLRELRAIRERYAGLVDPGFKSTDHAELLYDEYGIPK